MRIQLLGGVELSHADGTSARVSGPKQRMLLATLALELNRTVPTSRLIDLLWDGAPPPTARAALQGHVASLRRALGGELQLVTKGAGYALLGDPELVDAHRFDRLCSSAAELPDTEAVTLLRTALALWHGPWTAGRQPGDPSGPDAEQLAESRVLALEQLAERLLRLGRGAEAVDELSAAAEAYPVREPVAARLMLCLEQAGRRAEALQVYERVLARLADELGVDPGPRIRGAYQQVRSAGQPAGPAEPARERRPVPAQLPREARGFAGRAAELSHLDEAVARAGASPVLVSGAAGVGKTSLVLRWARQQAHRFPDGQLYVNLRGFDEAEPLEPGVVLGRFLRALGVADEDVPRDPEDRADLYRAILAERQMLVVLDNARSYGQLAPLLGDSATVVHLVTSRNRIGDLVVREGAVPVPLEALALGDALAVLGGVVGAARIAVEPAAAERIVRLCDRLPLAIRIAGARLATRPDWPLAELAGEISDEQARLAALSTDGSLGVASALALTCRNLRPEAARLFALLGGHSGEAIDAYTAAALGGVTLAGARELLARLDGAHLVHESVPGLFTRHDLVRLYTRQLNAELPSAEREPADDRLLDYYIASSMAALDAMGRQRKETYGSGLAPSGGTPPLPDAARALGWFRREDQVVLDLVDSAAQRGSTDPAWQLAHCAAPGYMRDGGRLRDWERLSRAGLAAAGRSGSLPGQIRCSLDLGFSFAEQERYEDLVELMESVVPLADRLGEIDLRYYTRTLTLLARGLNELGRHARALDVMAEVVALTAEAGDPRMLAAELNNFALCWLSSDAPAQAIEHVDRAVALLADRPADPILSDLRHTRAAVLAALGRTDDALDEARRGLELCRTLVDVRVEPHCLELIGDLLDRQGSTAQAVDHWRQALDVYDRQGRPAVALRERLAAATGGG